MGKHQTNKNSISYPAYLGFAKIASFVACETWRLSKTELRDLQAKVLRTTQSGNLRSEVVSLKVIIC